MLETACAQAALWAALPGRKHFTVSVNVSARQFRLPNFVEPVLAVLAASANPHNLELELTESMLLDNIEDTIAKMTALKAVSYTHLDVYKRQLLYRDARQYRGRGSLARGNLEPAQERRGLP